jgi:hypothetical protein
VEPQRRVIRIAGANNGDAEIGDRKQATPHRVRMAGSIIEIVALDKEKREHRGIANASDLRPQPTSPKRPVEVGDGLPLHERTALDAVIARGQRFDHDPSTEPLQTRRHTAALFEHVRGDNKLCPRRLFTALPQLSSGGASPSCSRASVSRRSSV